MTEPIDTRAPCLVRLAPRETGRAVLTRLDVATGPAGERVDLARTLARHTHGADHVVADGPRDPDRAATLAATLAALGGGVLDA